MKKQWILPGIITAAFAIAVSACTSAGTSAFDDRYLNVQNVGKVDCKTVDLAGLENTLRYVEGVMKDASPGTVRDMLEGNPEGTTGEKLQQELSGKIATCKQVNKDTVAVVANDGTRSQLPVVPDNVDVHVGASVNNDPDTPPVATSALLQRCQGVVGWDQLVTCVGDEQWYKDGFTIMSSYTEFKWEDVLHWAKAKQKDGKAIDARVIHVYGLTRQQKSEAQAKDDVRALINDDNALKQISVVYHSKFVNSRGLENERVSPFVDEGRQVRVALAPLVLNEKDELESWRGDAGVFVECLNIWGMPYAIAPAPNTPAVCPNNGMPIPPEGPKGCNPPGTSTTSTTSTCVGCTTTTTTPPVEIKDPKKGSNNQGNVTEGGQKAQPGPGTLDPPPIVVTTTRVNPPQPPPPPAGTQTATPTNTGNPPPPNPGAGPSNSGTVAPPP